MPVGVMHREHSFRDVFCCLAVIDFGLNMYCTVAIRVGQGLGVYSSFVKSSKRFLLRVGDVEGNGMNS